MAVQQEVDKKPDNAVFGMVQPGELQRAWKIFVCGSLLGTMAVAAVTQRYGQSVDAATASISVLGVTSYFVWRVAAIVLGFLGKPEAKPESEQNQNIENRALMLPVLVFFGISCSLVFGIVIVGISSLIYRMLSLDWAVTASAEWAFWLFAGAFVAFVLGVVSILAVVVIQNRQRLFQEILKVVFTIEANFQSRIAH